MKATGLKNDAIEQKADLSLIPLDLLDFVSKAYEYGTRKYKRNSHRGGFETHRTIAAALRHIAEWNDKGQEYDKDAWEREQMKVHHLGMAIFNLISILNSIRYKPELVNNYIPENFTSEVPLDDEPQVVERIERLRKFWLEPKEV